MIGLGERADSGLLKICEAWEKMGYSIDLHDSFEPYDQRILTLKQIEVTPEVDSNDQVITEVTDHVKRLLLMIHGELSVPEIMDSL